MRGMRNPPLETVTAHTQDPMMRNYNLVIDSTFDLLTLILQYKDMSNACVPVDVGLPVGPHELGVEGVPHCKASLP